MKPQTDRPPAKKTLPKFLIAGLWACVCFRFCCVFWSVSKLILALGQMHDVSYLICLHLLYIRFVRFGSVRFSTALGRLVCPVHIIIHNLLHNFCAAIWHSVFLFRLSSLKSFHSVVYASVIRQLKYVTFGMWVS